MLRSRINIHDIKKEYIFIFHPLFKAFTGSDNLVGGISKFTNDYRF